MSPQMGRYTLDDDNAIMAAHAALRTGVHGVVIVRKTADETVNNSNVLQDDDELFFAVGANEVWELTFIPLIDSPAIPDIKFAWGVPAGAELYRVCIRRDAAGALQIEYALSGGSMPSQGVAVPRIVGIEKGLYIGGVNAGNVQLQWAQETANVSDTKVLANSCIIAHRLA